MPVVSKMDARREILLATRHWPLLDVYKRQGYAHFFTGPFLNRTGAHADEDFFYAAVTFTF